VYGKMFQKLLTTDKGIEALEKAANRSKYPHADVNAAITYINSVLRGDD
jgi:hypothetical protein